LDAEVLFSIGPELLHQMHSNLDNEKLQERLKKILKDLDKRTHLIIYVIKDFIKVHPEDASVAQFGFELIRYGSFTVNIDIDNNDIFQLSVGSMIRHEKDPIVQEYAIHCMKEARDCDSR
jgi:predicted ATPase